MNGLAIEEYDNTNAAFYGDASKALEFALADLEELRNKGRKVIILHHSVYDVTDYLHHPGGLWFRNRTFNLDPELGFDRTSMFEETTHTDLTRETVLRHYLVGRMKGQGDTRVPRMGEYKFPEELAFKPVDLRGTAQTDYSLLLGCVVVTAAAGLAAAWYKTSRH